MTQDVKHCGECLLFRYEDTYGYGLCEIQNDYEHCGNKCFFADKPLNTYLTAKATVKVLRLFNKYRMGKSDVMLPVRLYSIALGSAIRHCRRLDAIKPNE
ncbi:MAG: hypothetical protein HUK08_00305 [Bacteroidaceae bacterium]|nr:hypothetical protein [Bacteroidaceae bacterium]